MKFGCRFSIFILLCILPSFAFAILCPTRIIFGRIVDHKTTFEIKESFHELYNYTGATNCDDACVYYKCGIKGPIVGCPADFYEKCKEFSSDIDFIQSKSPNNMDYRNGTLRYISGCGGEDDGRECIKNHVANFLHELDNKDAIGENEKGSLVWHDRGGSSGSSNQNGAFKFIGIIAFGWILAAAVAWIH